MRLVKEAHRERQPLRARELGARVFERVEVVADLAHVVERLAIVLLSFILEQIDERGLRALNLRGDNGLLSDEGVDEPVERRDHLARDLEAGHGLLGSGEKRGPFGVDVYWWVPRGKAVRDVGGDLFATYGSPQSSASCAHVSISRKGLFTKTRR